MPTFDEKQKKFYSTRKEVLQKFRDEQKQKCTCRIDEWAGNFNQITCLNCIRKQNLEEELRKNGFWTNLKELKYWKVRRQGQYKQLKIASVYSKVDWSNC